MCLLVCFIGTSYQCMTSFQVMKYESNVDFATDATPTWSDSTYSLVASVPATSTYVTETDPHIVTNRFTFTVSKALNG